MAEQRQRLEAVITASSQGFVDALKKASAAVNDSTASWKDRFTKARGDLLTMKEAVDNLKSAAKEMGELGLNADPKMGAKLEENLQRMRDALGTTGQDIRTVMDGINDLKNAAHSLNLPVDEYQRLSDAAKDAGVGMASAEGMLSSMRDRIEEFMNGVPEAVDLFNQLGVSIEDVGSRSGMMNFVNMAEAVRGMVSPTEQAKTASDMFGHSVDDVSKILAEYKRSLMDRKDSEFITDRDVQQAIAYRKEVEALEKRMGPLGQKIEEVATVSSRFSANMRDVSEEFRRAIDTYGKYVEGLPKSLKPTMEVMDALRDLREEVSKMINSFSTMRNARPEMLKYYDELLQESGGKNNLFSEQEEQALKERIESVCRYFVEMKEVASNEFREIGDKWAQMRALFENMQEWSRSGDIRLLNVKPEQLLFNAESLIEARKHVEELHKIVEEFFKSDIFNGKKKIDFIDLDSLRKTADELRKMFDDYTEKMKTVAPADFAKRFDILNVEIEKFQAKLDGLMNKDVTLRPKVDSSEMKNLEKEYDSLVEKVRSFASLYNEMQSMSNEFVENKGHQHRFDFTIDHSQMALAKTLLDEIGDGAEGVKKSFEKIQDESRKLSAGLMENENKLGSLSGKFVQLLKDGADGFVNLVSKTYGFGKEVASTFGKLIAGDVKTAIENIRGAAGDLEAMGRVLGGALSHPVQTAKTVWNDFWEGVKGAAKDATIAIGEKFISIGDAIKNAWHWMTHFKIAVEDSQHPVKDVGNQLLRIGGLLFGIRSMNMAVVKGFRTMADAAKEVAKWWYEAAKRQAEFKAGLATDATNQFKENRKEAEDRMNLSKRYAEAVGKANVSGKREDEAEAEAIRRELWEKHGVEANRDNARSVFKEMSESYYDTRVSQNEAETAMYKELVGQYRKALEERKKYLVSVFGMGSNLSMKMGEDTVYTDLTKKMGDAQKRLAELTKERTELGRTQRGGEYADFAAIRGGRNTDAWRERIKKQREKSDKTIEKRRKDAEKADAEIESWLDELDTLDEEERKVVKANEKYAKLVREGGDKRKAREALDLAVSKIREEASKKDAEAVNRLVEQHERQLERLKDADRKELDARRKMEEAERDLADATRRAKDDVRLKRIGREKERIKDRMSEFGFSVPKNLKTGLTGKERAEIRRNAKIDASIGKKLEKEKKGERVTYTPRERRRLDEYRGLERKLKGLEAEEKQMKAAQTQERAANTIQNATEKFQEAVRAFYKAQTGKDLESKKEQRARERKEKRQREKAKKDDMRRRAGMRPSGGDGRPTGGDGSGRPPRGQAPAPAPRPRPAPAPAPKPAPAPERREEPQASRTHAKFLEFGDFLERFVGDAQNAERYYRKYVEAYNRTYGTENEADIPRRTEEYPPTEIERKLPPEYENATRDQKNRAMWNRRANSQDYDDEGRWRHSPEAWRVRVDESREDAEKWGRETGWMPGAMTQRDFERVVAGLYAPPRFTEAGNADQHDYTALLERIATAIEHGDKNTFTVK